MVPVLPAPDVAITSDQQRSGHLACRQSERLAAAVKERGFGHPWRLIPESGLLTMRSGKRKPWRLSWAEKGTLTLHQRDNHSGLHNQDN